MSVPMQTHNKHNAMLDAADEFRTELPNEVADALSVGSALKLLWNEVN